MFRNAMPRYEMLSQDAMAKLDAAWRRLMTEVGVEFMSDRALDLFRAAGQRVEENTVFLDPEFVLEQVAKAPREFDVAARNKDNSVHIGGDAMAFGAVYGPPFVRQGDVRRDATMEDFRNVHQARAGLPGARLGRRGDLRAQRHPARLPPPRHDVRAADADRQDLHGQRRVRRQRPRHDRDGRDHVRRPRRHRADAGQHLADQLQLAAALGRPDARRPVRVLGRQPARRPDAVHPDGRHVAGDDPGRARPADRRGAVRHRPVAADPARLPGHLRLVPVQHRHAVGLADLRHARSRPPDCCARGRSPGTSGCRSAPAARSRRRRSPTPRPATRR